MIITLHFDTVLWIKNSYHILQQNIEYKFYIIKVRYMEWSAEN